MAGLIARKGAPITFTSPETASAGSSYDPATDTSTVTPGTPADTVTGRAAEIAGDPELYKALSLIESDNPTLQFTPDTVGQMPPLGSSCVWGPDRFTVKNIKRLAMSGVAKAAHIVVGR